LCSELLDFREVRAFLEFLDLELFEIFDDFNFDDFRSFFFFLDDPNPDPILNPISKLNFNGDDDRTLCSPSSRWPLSTPTLFAIDHRGSVRLSFPNRWRSGSHPFSSSKLVVLMTIGSSSGIPVPLGSFIESIGLEFRGAPTVSKESDNDNDTELESDR